MSLEQFLGNETGYKGLLRKVSGELNIFNEEINKIILSVFFLQNVIYMS